MPTISIVTCISNEQIYDQCLLESIKRQRRQHDIEIIPIFNYDNISASAALNRGIAVSRSNIIICCHQDVKLLDNWFDRLLAMIDENDKWGVIGVAGIALQYSRADIGRWGGAVNRPTVAVGTVYPDDVDEPYWNGDKSTCNVHSVDECAFVINKKSGLRFDESLSGFHFYAVDLSLTARISGFDVICGDLPIVHYGKFSSSISDDSYWPSFIWLYEKWHKHFPEMLGTHIHWDADGMTSYIPITLSSEGFSAVVRGFSVQRWK